VTVPARVDPRPRATAAMLAAMGCVSSSNPEGTRPMLIANTGLNYRVWIKDGLESRTLGSGVKAGLPIVGLASCPRESSVRAYQGGDYGI
jgi:hypothetical protein